MTQLVTIQEKKEYCTMLATSDLLPPHYKGKPQNILLALEFGDALGIRPALALQHIYVVEGKPSLSANMMMSLIMGSGKGHVNVIEESDKACKLEGVRYGENGREDMKYNTEFTMMDATKAGLADRPNYKRYPKDMLFSKALGRLARRLFGDLCNGIYVAGELDELESPLQERSTTPPKQAVQTTPKKSEPIQAEYTEVKDVYTIKYETLDKAHEFIIGKLLECKSPQDMGKLDADLKTDGVVVQNEPQLKLLFRARSNALRGIEPSNVGQYSLKNRVADAAEDDLPY